MPKQEPGTAPKKVNPKVPRDPGYLANVRGLFNKVPLGTFDRRVEAVKAKYGATHPARSVIMRRIQQAAKRRPVVMARRQKSSHGSQHMQGYPNRGVPMYKLFETKKAVYEGNERRREQTVPAYKFFNNNESGNFRAQSLTAANQQAYLAPPPPPPICAAEIAKGLDPLVDPCFKAGLKDRLAPFLKKVESGAWQCQSGKDELGGHQIVVREVAKMFAAKPPKRTGDRRGLLVFQNTGAGKTVSAMAIMAEFWESGRKIVFCTTIKNQAGNPPSEYAKNALVFFPEKADIIFKGVPLPPKPWSNEAYRAAHSELAKWCQGPGAAAIEKKIGKIWTFWRLGSTEAGAGDTLEKTLLVPEGSVLIIDESQNLFKPSTEKEKKACLNMGRKLQEPKFLENVIVFPLTATPGDTAEEYVNMLNVVRPVGTQKMTVREIVADPRRADGLVSYADIRGDKTHYGTISDGTSTGPRDIEIPHTPKYFAAMAAAFGGPTWSKEVRDLDAHPGSTKKYFVYSRVGGCVLPATAVRPFFSGEELEVLARRHQFVKVDNSQALLSEKMRVALERAVSMPGCQFIYVPDAKVLKAVASSLGGMGFESVKASTHIGHSGGIEIGAPGKRFFAFHDGTVNGEPKPAGNDMKSILNFFKSTRNKHGDFLKIFVSTVHEGLDMSWLRGVHLCAPLPTQADDDQAVGRALRYCGHDVAARTVAVYRYLGLAPKTLDMNGGGGGKKISEAKQKQIENAVKKMAEYDSRGTNVFVREDADRRGKPLSNFVACIQAQSIECGILDPIQFGRKVTCGSSRCPVQLDATGTKLVIPARAAAALVKRQRPQAAQPVQLARVSTPVAPVKQGVVLNTKQPRSVHHHHHPAQQVHHRHPVKPQAHHTQPHAQPPHAQHGHAQPHAQHEHATAATPKNSMFYKKPKSVSGPTVSGPTVYKAQAPPQAKRAPQPAQALSQARVAAAVPIKPRPAAPPPPPARRGFFGALFGSSGRSSGRSTGELVGGSGR